MHFVFAMDGTLPLCPPCVFVVPHLPSTMRSTACHCGAFPSLRHNKIHDITASLMKEVCPQVCVKPTLQPLSGQMLQLILRTTPDWMSEPRVSEVDNNMRTLTLKCSTQTLPRIRKNSYYLYRTHERQKGGEYEDHITNYEHGSFSPPCILLFWRHETHSLCGLPSPGQSHLIQTQQSL